MGFIMSVFTSGVYAREMTDVLGIGVTLNPDGSILSVTGPTIGTVAANPDGTTANAGSLLLGRGAGAGLWHNTDGSTTWTKIPSAIAGTGLLTGGTLSVNGGDNTKFDISVGTGVIVDESGPAASTQVLVTIAARVGISDAFPTEATTYLLIDGSDVLTQQATAPTPLERRTGIAMGRIAKVGGVIVVAVNNPSVAYGQAKTLEDVLDLFGGVGSGSDISANSDLTIDLAVGNVVSLGRGRLVNPQLPNTNALPAQSPVPTGPFFKVHENNTGDLIIDNSSNSLDPNQFNSNNVLAAVPPLEYTIQRTFIFSDSNVFAAYYGNATYKTLQAALDSRETEDWQEHSDSLPGRFLGWIFIQEGVTDLAAALAADPPRAAIALAGTIRPPVARGTGGVPNAIFGQFSDSTTQKPGTTNPTLITFDTTDESNGIGHARTEDFLAQTAGLYALSLQPQTERTGSGGDVVFQIWVRMGRRDGAVTAVTTGNPTPVTAPDHRITTGQTVTLSNLTTTPTINGARVVTVVDVNTFTVPVNTSAVADGVGDWTRQLDATDDVSNSTREQALQSVNQSDALSLFRDIRLEEEDVLQCLQAVGDATKGAGIVAKVLAGKPNLPSVTLSINKVGDQ